MNTADRDLEDPGLTPIDDDDDAAGAGAVAGALRARPRTVAHA